MAEEKTIRIGTRGSKLALWQANYVKEQLDTVSVKSEIVIISTKGDQVQNLSFDKIEGKGFFTKEIEDQLLAGQVDLAVHSMKDLPTSSPEGLVIAGVSYRESPEDVLLISPQAVDRTQTLRIKANAIVGTSSARRKAQMLDFRSDIQLKDIRGNVPTRIKKLREGQFDAIVLAAAGLNRLQIDVSDLEVVKMNPREMIPAPAQGVIAYQCRIDDLDTRKIVNQIHQREVARCTNIERTVLKLLDGGCHIPLGVFCEKDGDGNYHVWAAKAERWDTTLVKTRLSSSTNILLAEKIVEALEKQLKET